MKKITGLLLAAVLCMPAYAAQTKNTMKMVSYFPVPYVAYDTVSANNAMDIGVLNQCAMDIKKGTSNLGGSACSLYLYGDPNAADLNSGLLNVTAGKLDLNSNVTNARIVSKKVQIGKDMTTIGGWLDIGMPSGKSDSYDALYISSLKNTGNSFRVTSKESGAKVNSFHMFNEISNDFPGCTGTVTWQELELAANIDKNETYTDVYLVCNGTGGTTEGDECSDGEVSGSQSCNGCGEQTTKKCVNGKWTDSLGTCSKTAEECNTCQESTTSWTEVSSLPQDTCPGGNTDVEFSCDGGFVGTCTDVRSTPADRQIGETNTLAFDPPSGYVWGGPTCSPQQRKEKAKVASGFASESIISRHNYAIASCSDLSSGNMVNNLPWGFHLLAPGGGIEEWVDYGVITKECPVDLSGPWDGGYEMCRRICGITDPTDTHGCRSRERCYVKPQFNNECGNLTAGHPVLGNGFSVYTCDEHAGGRKWKFRLYQCDAKYEKRTVTCCGN